MGSSAKSNDNYVLNKYDLKGSMVKREVFSSDIKNTSVLKDKNFLNLKRNQMTMLFKEQDIKKIMNIIGKDIILLKKFGLMDYSLLLVIEYNKDYVEYYPEEFVKDQEKKLVYPIKSNETDHYSNRMDSKKRKS
jgi:hypothetical protein